MLTDFQFAALFKFVSRNVKYDPKDVCVSGRALTNMAYKKGGPVAYRGGTPAVAVPIFVPEFGKTVVMTTTPVIDAMKQILTTPGLEDKFVWGHVKHWKNGVRVYREFNSGDWSGNNNS